MPGLKELEHFRDELSKLGNEREVTAERGEAYEELPLPSAIESSAPQINVDDLLSSLGSSAPDQNTGFMPPDSVDPLSLLDNMPSGAPDTSGFSLPDFDLPTPPVPSSSKSPAPKNSAPPPVTAADGFDDLLASLQLDEPVSAPKTAAPTTSAPLGASPKRVSSSGVTPASAAAGTRNRGTLPETDDFAVPEDLLAGFADEVTESRKQKDGSGVSALDELALPQTDGEDFEMPSFDMAPDNAISGDFPSFDMNADAGAADIPSLGTLDAITGDLPSFDMNSDAGAEEFPSFDMNPEGISEASSVPDVEMPKAEAGLDEFADLLSDVGEPATSDAAVDTGTSDFEIPDLAMGDLESFESPDASGAPSMDFTPPLEMDLTPMDEIGGTEDLAPPSFGDESAIPDFSAGVPDFPSPPDFGESAPSTDSFDFPGLSDIPAPGSFDAAGSEPVSTNFGDDFADFSIPADLDIGDGASAAPAEPAPLDGFDGFSLDDDVLKTTLDDTGAGLDDFHIPGFSDFTSGGAARPALSEFPGVQAQGKKSGKKEVPLRISETDFKKFLDILASYPLNLRIGVEEFLSGDVGTEVQKMELVHSILAKTSVHKIAHVVGDYISRMISIPKDYEKKSVEEYEREKASLRYVLRNKILPAAILFTIVAVLTACTFYLSYRFIYRPLVAEDLYKRGYAAIEDSRYSESLEFFDRAVRVWEKEKWYFTYAEGFRGRKQYISAELMYERIMLRYPKERKGYLDYAEMLRTDLRNFEKAEDVLRRRFLVDFVNDRDGLMLLGDTYLDWAEEDPEKYEAARQTYANLIELYGPEDPFLARMMRYFIRTDNLKEVLPLKDHFKSKKAKIGAQDLVELSGYMLQKRYEPKPDDSEILRDRIDDLRNFLERAVKAGPSIPEAHYNLGRFFIYNYQNDLAIEALSEALKQFDSVTTMSPKRVLSHIDAFRLLGECRVENLEFLDAQSMYAQGIALYEDQRANRSVRSDTRVGKLYSDYGDIDYFISNDLDSALRSYSKAIDELYDTSSVRYRIGYIQYQKQDYEASLYSFDRVHSEIPSDRNLLYGYGNALFRRGDYFAAQGYYERLMEDLNAERERKGILLPQVRPDHGEFVDLYMRATNNFGVILNRIAIRTGDSRKNARALALLADSARAWDALTRNPETLVRAQGTNLAFLNIQNLTRPAFLYEPEIYADIPKVLVGEKVLQQRIDE